MNHSLKLFVFKSLIHSKTKQMIEKYFIDSLKKLFLFRNDTSESSVCVFVSEPFIQAIRLIHSCCPDTDSVVDSFGTVSMADQNQTT